MAASEATLSKVPPRSTEKAPRQLEVASFLFPLMLAQQDQTSVLHPAELISSVNLLTMTLIVADQAECCVLRIVDIGIGVYLQLAVMVVLLAEERLTVVTMVLLELMLMADMPVLVLLLMETVLLPQLRRVHHHLHQAGIRNLLLRRQ